MESERPSFDRLLQLVKRLPNGELTHQLRQLNEQRCVRDAELLLYLSELDQRGLYRQEAVSSLFDFCVSRLGYSEDTAWKRVGAARLMRRFPLVFDLLSTGKIHLSALMLVKPHLTEENHRDWLLAASGKSKRQVEMLVARRCPKPDVATSIRKLPEPRSQGSGDISGQATATLTATTAIPMGATAASNATAPLDEQQDVAATQRAAAPNVSAAARIAPLSGSSYRVTFTVNARLKQKLDRARELASHVVSPSDLPGLLERALDLLILREERRRYAIGVKSRAAGENHRDSDSQDGAKSQDDATHHAVPKDTVDTKQQPCQMRRIGKAAAQDPGRLAESDAGDRTYLQETVGPLKPAQPAKPRSRYVPAAVRREIWQRDQGRCTFTDAQGNRCEERCFLEIEHLVPFALNGATSASNCTLRCRCHNTLAAEASFGRSSIESAIIRARKHRSAIARTREPTSNGFRSIKISSAENEEASLPNAAS